MWTYYRDVTLYTLAICFFLGIASSGAFDSFAGGLLNMCVIFGVFGTGLGVLAFSYFQKQQYYMYHNLGFTKKDLILRTWGINLGIGILIALLIAMWI
ncbi:hypothetical protein EAX61_10135 [Dokdonia sinensis]|uniref:Uncharacterized protein n=1 Tax=Dokdonia sinensis TaxID=2479847 RepID=A0A3M0G1B1_9FLAO|nr:hypothetical protein [Dokdonia sinensis]RMB57977.1 hypothetical protein EAX61_10135 [Dokdonia sinensis]